MSYPFTALTSLIGRDSDVAAIVRRLDHSRLITLTGPGGVGKTRLARRVMTVAATTGFADGIRIVELSEMSDADRVVRTAARALGLGGVRSVAEAGDLARRLGNRDVLLLLDGCEQSGSTCAMLVATLLRAWRGLRVLATSVQVLGVPGEQRWPVAPLSVPPSPGSFAEIGQTSSVQLFVERLIGLRPDFRLTEANAVVVGTLCWRLDGLPLALELAAGRAALLGLEQVAALVQDGIGPLATHERGLPSRHHTLSATLVRDWGLLDEAEQRLLRRLAVFSGGGTLDAVALVCSDEGDLPKSAILDLLTRLTAKSAVVAEPGDSQMRYRLRQTQRGLALERLALAGELERLHLCHLKWCLGLALSRQPATVEAELDNIRAALEWASQSHAQDQGLRLAMACWALWVNRGYAEEGQSWLSRLTSPARPLDLAGRAEVACLAGGIAAAQGHTEPALANLTLAVRLAEECGEWQVEGPARHLEGELLLRRGQFPRARTALEIAARVLDDRTALAIHTRARLATACVEVDDELVARAQALVALTLAEASGRSAPLACAWEVAGSLADREGSLDSAADAYGRAVAKARQVNVPHLLAEACIGLARIFFDQRKRRRARAVLRQLLRLAHEPSVRWLWPRILETAAEFAAPIDPALAARLGGAAEGAGRQLGTTLWPSQVARRQRWLDGVQVQLGPAWQKDWDTGGLLDAERALAEAYLLVGDGATDVAGESPVRALSARERQVALLLSDGFSNQAIAEALRIRASTVRLHVSHVLGKLGLQSRMQVAARLRDPHALA